MSEAPLLALLMELEKEKASQIQVPTLAKPSIYHKVGYVYVIIYHV